MAGIGMWAPLLLRAALWTLFPNLRPLCSVEELDTCSEALPLLLTGEGVCPSGWLLAASLRERTPYRPIALLESRCTPLSIWIAWKIRLNGILDLTRTPEEWAETLSHLARGRVAWPSDLVDQAIAFERALGWRLRRLSARDWRRWRDLAAGLPLKALAARWGSLPCWREPLSPPPRSAAGGAEPNGLTLLGLCHRDLGRLSQRPPTGTPSSGLATPSHHRRSARCQKSEHPHVKKMNTPGLTALVYAAYKS